jgi:hypothetical protein
MAINEILTTDVESRILKATQSPTSAIAHGICCGGAIRF